MSRPARPKFPGTMYEEPMTNFLVAAGVVYFLIGVALTAFCVHMSYHEAAIGFGDSDDFKAQKVLESKMGVLGFIFLCTCWPLALLIAFMGKRHATPEVSEQQEIEGGSKVS